MKNTRPFQVLFLLVVDLAAILSAWGVALWTRVHTSGLFAKDFSNTNVSHLMPSLFMTMATLSLSLAAGGLYTIPRRMGPGFMARIFNSATLGTMLLIAGMFFLTRKLYSRSLMGLFWVSLVVFLLVGRWATLKVFRSLKARGIGAQKVAIMGVGEPALAIAGKLHQPKEARFQLAGFIHSGEPGLNGVRCPEPFLGVIADLTKLINRNGIDRLIIAEPSLSRERLAMVAQTCNRMDVSLELIPDAMGFLSSMEAEVSDLDGTPLLVFRKVGFTRWQEISKRLLDIAVTSIAGLLALPLCCLIGAAIRAETEGPVLFRQKRIGKGGKAFRLHKFRTMFKDAEGRKHQVAALNKADGYIFKIENDPRVTRVGRLLRATSLDELPQLINVFRGDMSLVGPRPLPMEDLPEDASGDQYKFWMESRERVLPGITGLWQTRGRSELAFNDMVRFDLFYLEHWSLRLDIEILFRTIPVVLFRRGAY